MYVHIIDRSDLEQVVSRGKDGSTTRREDLQMSWDSAGQRHVPRADVVLVNGTRSGKQYTVMVDRYAGFVGDLFILDFLSDKQYDQVVGIQQRMLRNADEFEPARLLVGGWE